jgi:putative endonuclease
VKWPGDPAVGKQYYVYIMTNQHNTVLYTGVTNDLRRRAYEHKTGRGGGFTSRYDIRKLVYYEVAEDVRLPLRGRSRSKGDHAEKRSIWSMA